ncbi:glycoside hydrolase family 2 protein [bacterium]|nr:MAG: glycoside hydrolase family 2 protein [bacterium]
MQRNNFNAGWTFYKKGHEKESVVVDLPHDAMIHEKRIPKLKNGPMTSEFPGGDYYYTKNLHGREEYAGKTVLLEFEGVYMDSSVHLNDERVGGRFYGYSNFYADLIGKLRIGQDNEIKVFVHNSQVPNARWYPGSGIYRPVKLIVGNREHIELDGVKIATKSYYPAIIEVTVKARTSEGEEIRTEISYDGKVVATCCGENCEVAIANARLWDEDHPDLYLAKVSLVRGAEVLDVVEERFGIRKIELTASDGLKINGRPVKLRGGCVHHDNGILGACAFEAAEYRKARILKEAGYNAIRSAHQPISKAMLNACDELGMYIMDESFDTWQMNVGLYDYAMRFDEDWEKDVSAMVLKDLNHPSVIMDSTGNEIKDTAFDSGIELAGKMTKLCHDIDSSRPVTCCVNLFLNVIGRMGGSPKLSDKVPKKEDVTDPLAEEKDSKVGGSVMINMLVATGPLLMKVLMKPGNSDKATIGTYSNLDIAGYNYGHAVYLKHLEMHPDRIIVGSETNPPAIAQNWALVKKDPRIIGDFMWTAWEYLGECGAGVIDYNTRTGTYFKPYPVIVAGCGAIDITGFRDTYAYLASIVWDKYENPYIGVRSVDHSGEKMYTTLFRKTDAVNSWSWNGCEGKKATIEIYSKGAQVELIQDGRSVGKKKLKEYAARFDTTYRPGSLEAVSYDENGKELGRAVLKTASEETVLTVTPETTVLKANGEDLAYIVINVTDNEGIVKVLEERTIQVRVDGAGTLQAVGSGNPRETEDYTGTSFTTYHGRMIAVVRSGFEKGEVKVTISTAGMESKEITLEAR